MRIAYITPYQGPTLVKQRPIVRNRSMSNKIKIELIAEALRSRSHQLEILSHGEVVESKFTFYPGFKEPEPFSADIPVYYASALPIRRLNGFWSCMRTLHLFKSRHEASPFDLVIIFNLKAPLVVCANYAMRHLRLPVILEYEDDVFVNLVGEAKNGFMAKRHHRSCRHVLERVRGGIAVSPHLLSQFPSETPKLLLRGVVGDDILTASKQVNDAKKNWVLFSGTHIRTNGVAQLIEAWETLQIPGWELHVTGYGEMTEVLRQMAARTPSVVFHGLVSRPELVRLMSSARICINPHPVSHTPGNVFAFKIIEYLAAGAHVITTPMGALEKDLEAGITYMPDSSPGTIAATIKRVIENRSWEHGTAHNVEQVYGPSAVAKSLDLLLQNARKR